MKNLDSNKAKQEVL